MAESLCRTGDRTIRRECLDQVIVLGERHLKKVLTSFFAYYHEARPHQSPADNAPLPRDVEPPELGSIVCTPLIGGLRHRYAAAPRSSTRSAITGPRTNSRTPKSCG